MFFFLAKILGFFINPFLWIISTFSFSIFSRREKWKKRWGYLSIVLLLLLTNNGLSGIALHHWEYQTIQLQDITKPYEVGIFLSGANYYHKDLPNIKHFIYLTGSGNRLVQSIELYKQGKIKKILLSGGAANIFGDQVSESEQVKLFLIRLGIPEKDIWLENKSRNTYENAAYTKALLEKKGVASQEYLLLTSAFHMTRAKSCFDKVGLSVIPFSVDFKTTTTYEFSIYNFLPTIRSLETWNLLLHEWIGIIGYKIKGYI